MNDEITIIAKNKIHVSFRWRGEVFSAFLKSINVFLNDKEKSAYAELKKQYPELLL